MTDLIVAQNNLPATLEDLSKFVLIGRDKLQAVRAEISAMKNLNLAKEVREQKLAEGQEIGKLVLLAEAKLGELFNQMPKAQGTRTDLQPLPAAGKKLDESEADVATLIIADHDVDDPARDIDAANCPVREFYYKGERKLCDYTVKELVDRFISFVDRRIP